MKTIKFDLAHYTKHGIAYPIRALSISCAQSAYQRYLELCDAGNVVLEGEQRIFGHLKHHWIADLVGHPIVMDAVRSVIGPNVLAWVSEFNAKAPRTPNFFSWHQDLFYWRHQYPDPATIPMVTVWLALSPATQESGGMRIIPGSHDRLLPHQSRECSHNLLTRSQEICVEVNEDNAVPVDLAPTTAPCFRSKHQRPFQGCPSHPIHGA